MAATLLADQVDHFVDLLRQRLRDVTTTDPALRAEIQALLDLWPEPRTAAPKVVPHMLPAAANHFEQALTLGETGAEAGLCAALRPLAESLPWHYGYPPHPLHPDLPAGVAFAQIVGPDDLRNADAVLIGLTLVAPRTLYPAHCHPAVELYLPISGSGVWTAGDDAPTERPPGSDILHPTGVSHATEAVADPVLAIYTWRGDLVSPPVFVL